MINSYLTLLTNVAAALNEAGYTEDYLAGASWNPELPLAYISVTVAEARAIHRVVRLANQNVSGEDAINAILIDEPIEIGAAICL